MAVYVMIDICIRDPAAKADYARYIEAVRPIVEKHGGRYLVRGGRITQIVGDWKPERLVLIEFPSADHIKQWWNSPEYKAIAGLREQSTEARAIIVEGCETETPFKEMGYDEKHIGTHGQSANKWQQRPNGRRLY